jgi:hypothetical protein
MKYTCSIDIDLPRDRVIALFDDADNLLKWQEGLISFEHLDGTPGQVGAKSRLRFKAGRRDILMIETITERNFPDSFAGTYEADGVWNLVTNRFTEAGEGRTHWEMDAEFRGKGIVGILIRLAPWMFRNQSRKMMQSFKDFAESA